MVEIVVSGAASAFADGLGMFVGAGGVEQEDSFDVRRVGAGPGHRDGAAEFLRDDDHGPVQL
jgi:hypothetical protein